MAEESPSLQEDNDLMHYFQAMDAVGQQQREGETEDTSGTTSTVDPTTRTAGTFIGGGLSNNWVVQALKDPKSLLPRPSSVGIALSWHTASGSRLERVERLIMSRAQRPHIGQFVPVTSTIQRPDPVTGESLVSVELHKIWTLTFPFESRSALAEPTPLVMLHGFGVGSAFFCMNFDNLALGRQVIALDLPGFGRSSRPDFPEDHRRIEATFVDILEKWRQAMRLDRFILLGHSFGGFVSASYAFSFPERVEHLILVEPWGLQPYPDGINWRKPIPTWLRTHHDWEWVHAGGFLRACGPLGPLAVRGFSHYICKRFYRFLAGDAWSAADYIYQCNAIDCHSTEEALVNLSKKILWAKSPAIHKLSSLPLDFFVSFIYGEESWMDSSAADNFQTYRVRGTADLHMIPGVGHDSFAEDPPAFNQVVNAICSWADTRRQALEGIAVVPDIRFPAPAKVLR